MNYKKIMDKLIDEEALTKSNFYKELNICAEKGDKLSFITKLVEKYNCEFDDARMIAEYFIDKKPFPSTLTPQQIAHNNAVAREWQNKPKCPTCNSTNIEKISLGKKAVGGFMFGLFSSDVRKSMHCKNCGYKW